MARNKREHHKSDWFNKFYKSYWFILWFFIYGILFYLSTLLVTALGIQSYYFQIICIGIIMCIIARAISSQIHDFTFKLNFNLFVWTLVYILVLFGLEFIVSHLIINYWLAIITISLGLLIFIELFKKIPFSVLAVISILIFIAISVFNFYPISEITIKNNLIATSNNQSELNINSSNNEGKTVVTEKCRQRAMAQIGDYFVIIPVYGSYITGFLNDNMNAFTNINFSTLPVFYRIDETRDPIDSPDDYHTISREIRWGNKIGEHSNWMYGNLEREYFYSKKTVTDSDGVILGENKFTFHLKIDDISEYFSENGRYTPYFDEFKFLAYPIESVVTITECNFVD